MQSGTIHQKKRALFIDMYPSVQGELSSPLTGHKDSRSQVLWCQTVLLLSHQPLERAGNCELLWLTEAPSEGLQEDPETMAFNSNDHNLLVTISKEICSWMWWNHTGGSFRAWASQNAQSKNRGRKDICLLSGGSRWGRGVLLQSSQWPLSPATRCPLWVRMLSVSPLQVPSSMGSPPWCCVCSAQEWSGHRSQSQLGSEDRGKSQKSAGFSKNNIQQYKLVCCTALLVIHCFCSSEERVVLWLIWCSGARF